MNYFLKTFGCQANKNDSERLAANYQSRGYQEILNWRQADEIVVNTCSVRQRAEDRVAGFLKNVTDYFSGKKKPKIVITGCMTYHGEKKLKQLLPGIDQILPINKDFTETPFRKDLSHAYVPISTGCNAFCSYCVVPLARGREYHRPLMEILTEIKTLVNSDCRSITLISQNVNSHPQFIDLLVSLEKIEKIEKIDFLTSNPWNFSDKLIEIISVSRKIPRFLHLPVQSGSDRVLKLMNRQHNRTEYLNLINRIKNKMPDIILGTDIIVGFPGETDIDFQQTVNLVKEVGFQVAFVSQYSPRPKTAAAQKYSDDIPAKVKKQRWCLLDDLINKPNLKHRPCIS